MGLGSLPLLIAGIKMTVFKVVIATFTFHMVKKRLMTHLVYSAPFFVDSKKLLDRFYFTVGRTADCLTPAVRGCSDSSAMAPSHVT